MKKLVIVVLIVLTIVFCVTYADELKVFWDKVSGATSELATEVKKDYDESGASEKISNGIKEFMKPDERTNELFDGLYPN